MGSGFHTLGLPRHLLKSLERLKFETPTPIQKRAIPFALDGRDILGSAQTGTGKTAAFALPMLAHLSANPKSASVVLTPTRELAVQVMQAVRDMQDRSNPMSAVLLIGGEDINKQLQQMRRRAPRIIIGTPGRINDHLLRRSLRLDNADFLVLDETDRMLDMGFGVQVDKIVDHMPKRRQTLMFSATMPGHIVKMADKMLNNPERISVGSTTQPTDNITQEMIQTTGPEKYQTLMRELDDRMGSIIVFVRTKRGADNMARRLNRDKHSVDALHGNLRQNRRDRVIKSFRQKKCRILIATDVAARGLDIPHVEHVINFDLPQCPEDYIHRIGRTARAGATGNAVCIMTPDDDEKWHAIDCLMNPEKKKSRPPSKGKGRNKRGKGGGWKGKKSGGQGFKARKDKGPGKHAGKHADKHAAKDKRGQSAHNTTSNGGGEGHTGERVSRPAAKPGLKKIHSRPRRHKGQNNKGHNQAKGQHKGGKNARHHNKSKAA